MISSLRGTITHKSPTEVTIDVQGIGYSVHIPLSTFEQLGEVNTVCTIYTHLHVREDALILFGFSNEEERQIFRLLISVQGIGPRTAQGILSGISVDELRNYLVEGNTSALSTIPGIGRKTAERLVVELKDKMGRMPLKAGQTALPGESRVATHSETLLALTSLGYSRPAAEKALRLAVARIDNEKASVEELIKTALKLITK